MNSQSQSEMKMSNLAALVRYPLVVILGSTGTGKSKLAIDLAAKFKGEILSADSMQVYKGLDILTNKVTETEKRQVPHHLLSFIDPFEKAKEKFDVFKFRNLAFPIIEKILTNEKLPFIVGGTNYYIESILWQILIEPTELDDLNDRKRKNSNPNFEKIIAENEVLSFISNASKNNEKLSDSHFANWSNIELHAALELIDNQRAQRIHPNDIRKVIRSLIIFFETGERHSQHIQKQFEATTEKDQETNLNKTLGGPLRFPNCICLWIQAPKDILDERIDRRINAMIEKGLRNEIDDFMKCLLERQSNLDFCDGILQSIGFKEFESYIKLNPEEKQSEQGDVLFNEGIEKLKIVTKQYAKKQVRWITQRMAKKSRRELPPVYWLDGSSEEFWDERVTNVGIEILEAHLSGNVDNLLLKERKVPLTESNEDHLNRKCDVCNLLLAGSQQYEAHMKSAKHWKMVKRLKKMNEVSEGDVLVQTTTT